MKMALFLLNILLVVALFSMTAYNLFDKGKSGQEYSVVKRSDKKSTPVKAQATRELKPKKICYSQ